MEKLSKIKELLPQGAQTEIAKALNVGVSRVNNVLAGKAEDFIVIEAIARYYEDYKAKKAKAMQRIDALV